MLGVTSWMLVVGFAVMLFCFGRLAYRNHHPNTPVFWMIALVSLTQLVWAVFTFWSPGFSTEVRLLSRTLLGFPVFALFVAILVLRRDDHA